MNLINPQRPTVYVAHPLGGDIEANAVRAVRWLAWLMTNEPDHAFCVPWLPFVSVFRTLPDGAGDDLGHPFRDRCMLDNVSIARRCSGIVLVGGRCSNGMQVELEAVLDAGGWCASLLHLGDEPPKPHALSWIGVGPLELGRGIWERQP